MGKNSPIRIGSVRWFAGCLSLCLYVATAFQPASAVAALFFAGLHGHGHNVTIRVDGQHLDLVLSHHDEHQTANDHHAWPVEVLTLLAVAHDHEGNDHVLHFLRGTTPEKANTRIACCRTVALEVALASNTAGIQPLISADSPDRARPPPPVAPFLTCLRSIVLLV
jgi:hypothetical protein